MTDPFTPDTFADGSGGNTPITAAKLNNLETAVDKLDIQNTKGDLLAHNGTTQARLAVGTDGQVLTASSAAGTGLAWSTVSGGASNATTSTPGLVQLAGDLAGTATAPTVPGLTSKVASVTAANATVTVAGTATAPTVAVGTIAESQVTNLTADLAAREPLLVPTATKTANYTAAASDFVLADLTAAWTLTLPTAPPDKTRIGVKITVQPGTNVLTLALGGSDHFNTATGPTSGSISLLNQSVIWQYSAATATWIGMESDLPLSQLDTRYTTRAIALALVLGS